MSDSERLFARGKLAETLELMLGGKLSFIEGARIVSRHTYDAGFDPLDEPFVAFVAIASETDEVPVGGVRDQWHPDAVVKHIAQWERSEVWAKQSGEHECHEALALVRRSLADG